ncbi:hypothetical protein MVEN_02352900 [Mycena venus]|uniref:Uncharacterized protein n=1 Tax=Mycena venus TaxID=2733690 RepID=A0A8H7CEU7_9AGAR|nr:hypothetical protein MVEN_02352900 [Mycena venus]
MKFAVLFALAAAAFAAAVPVARDNALELRDFVPDLELRDLDAMALSHLVSRGIFEEAELVERGLFSSSPLKITFTDPSGSISAARKKQATKVLTKAVSKAQQKQFPFCSVAFGAGGSATFRCFSSASKNIGSQGPAGALKI